jgi:hypothetical protein
MTGDVRLDKANRQIFPGHLEMTLRSSTPHLPIGHFSCGNFNFNIKKHPQTKHRSCLGSCLSHALQISRREAWVSAVASENPEATQRAAAVADAATWVASDADAEPPHPPHFFVVRTSEFTVFFIF